MNKACVAVAGLYCGLGMAVPIVPMIAGVGAVLVVRAMLWSKKQNIRWNVCVIALAIMATFVTIEGQQNTSTFIGFWIGVFYGGLGQGIINIGKSTMMATLKERLGKALEAFMGTGNNEGDNSGTK